ncbi:MAG TPA: glycerol kinase GlpK [Burkholderiales bacterium]|jgi:glycerol kinase|nr:glycerol kinase GlpK [Burkholderiales bacterium]
MKAVLALDQGTTSSRAIVFDSAARPLGVAQKEFAQKYPQPGWVEHDPEEIWATQLETARQALRSAKLDAGDIVAVGITNQRETTVVWDRRTGAPIYNAIVWQDRRTAGLCDQFRAQGVDPLITGRTGLLLDAYFSGTKLRWVLDHVEGARARAERGELAFGTIDAWLVWKLTNGRVHVTDASNASRTLLFNIHTKDWDDKLLQLMRAPRAVLPKVVASSGVCGETEPPLFGRAIPIAGIAGDQQAALFGQQCWAPGMVKNTYGTGCFMLMQTGEQPVDSKSRLLTTVAWKTSERIDYALEGSVFIAGAVVQWLRDGLGLIRSSAQADTLAASVPDSGGVYFVPAFAGLGAPHWDAYARGAIVGLTRGTSAAHIARAALESIAFQTADVLDAMRADSGIEISELRVDGGASRSDLLMQFQADLLGVPVLRPRAHESTALGAAYLAGLATGFWRNSAELVPHWQLERRFEATMSAQEREARKAAWRRALGRAKAWAQAPS